MTTRNTVTEKLGVVRDLLKAVEVDLELGVITDVIEDLRLVDQLTLSSLDAAVQLARQQGRSWLEIGSALHTTAQGAHQRYGPRPTASVAAASEAIAGQLAAFDD